MALTPIHQFFVFNGELQPVSAFVASENEGGIYEVIRVIKGVPLFLEDHLERFFLSAAIAGSKIQYSTEQINSHLQLLIRQNRVSEGNMLLSCKRNLKAFFISHRYPGREQYQNGVVCGILAAERANPNAKVFQTEVRKNANRLIGEFGFYEVILVDHLGRITEGSRSNLFFIKGKEIITPPANEVLLGITRQRTIKCAKHLGYSVSEKDVALNDLGNYDAVFITGTSPKILPVSTIGEHSFNVNNKIARDLMAELDRLIAVYISKE